MFQIDNSTAVAAIPAPTPAGAIGYFTDGNPATGVSATILPAEFMNMLMMENLNILSAAGIAPAKGQYNQLSLAIAKIVQNSAAGQASEATSGILKLSTTPQTMAGSDDVTAVTPLKLSQKLASYLSQATETAFGWLKIATQLSVNAGADDSTAVTPKKLATASQVQVYTAFTAGGTATALTLTPSPPISAYALNQRFTVKFPVTAGLNPTLDVSAKGGKALKQYDSAGGKISASFVVDQVSDVLYDGVDFILLDQLPVAQSNKQGVRGAASNYRAFANGSSGNIAITADRVTLEDAAGNCVTVSNVNLTLNTLVAASATVSGMATAATVAGSGYGTYLWYNKTTGVLIATGDSSLSAPTSPATGFDFWARRGSFRCDQSANRYPLRFAQFNNECEFQLLAGTNVISYPTIITGSYPTPTTVSLASILPATASFATFAAGTTSGYVGFAPVGSFASTPGTGYLSPAQPNGFPFAAGYNASGPVPTCCGAISLNTLSVQYCGTGTPSILQCLGWRDNL